jgi:hypothetical protein
MWLGWGLGVNLGEMHNRARVKTGFQENYSLTFVPVWHKKKSPPALFSQQVTGVQEDSPLLSVSPIVKGIWENRGSAENVCRGLRDSSLCHSPKVKVTQGFTERRVAMWSGDTVEVTQSREGVDLENTKVSDRSRAQPGYPVCSSVNVKCPPQTNL